MSTELKAIRSQPQDEKNYPLRGYFLVLLRNEEYFGHGIIELTATLYNVRTNSDGYFVLGGEGLSRKSMAFNDVVVKSTRVLDKQMTDVIPNGSKAAYSVMLLYNKEGGSFSSLKLTQTKKILRVNNKIFTVLRNTVKNMVVYAGRSPINRCSNFDSFFPETI